jgi:hypothetical protein
MIISQVRKKLKVNEVNRMNIFRMKPFAMKPKIEVNIDAEFDIEHKRVFCIERLKNGQTVISYTMFNEIQTWYIYTTDEQHQTFVNRFRQKLIKEAWEDKQKDACKGTDRTAECIKQHV